MAFTESCKERLAFPADHLPNINRAANATPYAVGPVDMSKFRRVMAYVNVGAITAGNVAAYFQVSAESNANFANVSGGNTLTFTANSKEGTLELRSDQIGVGNRYLQLAVLVTTGPANVGAQIICADSHHAPGGQYDNANMTGRLVM